jgi:flagellar hook protein FlgE
MFPALNTAVSGLQQFQTEIDVIGNNIANVNTTAFKDARANFQDSFSLALKPNVQVGSGANIASIQNDFNQGAMNNTGIDTDLYINGQGFFIVKNTADNTQYATRAGDFKLDQQGFLTTQSGLRVQGYSDAALGTIGDIKIDAVGAPATAAPGAAVKSFSIDKTGKIYITLTDGTQFGQVLLQNYRDPSALLREGGNLFSATTAAGALTLTPPQAGGNGVIQSGALELSNVDLTGEMADLIVAQRAFQANARMITTSDEILQEVVNLKR